jgi:DNA-binding MarR family transcriptional regulator
MAKRSLSEMIDLFSHQFSQLESMTGRGVFKDLTMKQVYYFETLGQMNKPTYGEFAAKLGLSKPSVTAIVNKLIKGGYVQTAQDKDDKRSSRISLTRRGGEINKIHREMHGRFAQHIATVLDEEEQKAFASAMNKIIDSLL